MHSAELGHRASEHSVQDQSMGCGEVQQLCKESWPVAVDAILPRIVSGGAAFVVVTSVEHCVSMYEILRRRISCEGQHGCEIGSGRVDDVAKPPRSVLITQLASAHYLYQVDRRRRTAMLTQAGLSTD